MCFIRRVAIVTPRTHGDQTETVAWTAPDYLCTFHRGAACSEALLEPQAIPMATVGVAGLEPTISWSQTRRISYFPILRSMTCTFHYVPRARHISIGLPADLVASSVEFSSRTNAIDP